jgi:HSP20 family protein
MRWESLQDLVAWPGSLARAAGAATGWSPPVDVYETTEAFVILVELAGLEAGDFDVKATDDSVTVTGRRPGNGRPGVFLHVERGEGEFDRSFSFPHRIDVASVSAEFKLGLLTITVPKLTVPRAQRVPVSGD